MLKYVIAGLLALLVTFAQNFHAQGAAIKPIRKGSLVPAICGQLYQGNELKNSCLSEFQGKLLILDFWATNCPSCLAGMPDMLKLQQKFPDKIKVLLVTENTPSEIQNLWMQFRNNKKVIEWIEAGKQLPFIVGDTVLSAMFPHKAAPVHVWIDSSQVFYNITYNTTTTEANIAAFLKGEKIFLDELRDLDINISKPLSWLDTSITKEGDIKYYSFFTSYIESGGMDFPPQVMPGSVSGTAGGISCFNKSVIELYKIAYNDWDKNGPVKDNRILIESRKNNLFNIPVDKEIYFRWAEKNMFCFALKMPASSYIEVFDKMKKEIDNYFNLKSRIETRSVQCVVLKRIPGAKDISSTGKPEKFERSDKHLILQNQPVAQLYRSLNRIIKDKFPELPFLEETGIKKNIDIELPWKTNPDEISISELRTSLKKYGLNVVEEPRSIEMLVISDD